jgi:pre-mRNA-splicing factor CWC22
MSFIAHLVNQQVAHEVVALEILVLLLERPSDDSVEIAVGFMREVGAFLAESAPKANNSVYDRFRAILHESSLDKRVQYMIEVLFQVRKDKFKDNPIVPEGLDLVEEDDMITHTVKLDDELRTEDMLSMLWCCLGFPRLFADQDICGTDIFKFDPEYAQNEEKYKEIKEEILGGDESDVSGESVSDEEEEEAETGADGEFLWSCFRR